MSTERVALEMKPNKAIEDGLANALRFFASHLTATLYIKWRCTKNL